MAKKSKKQNRTSPVVETSQRPPGWANDSVVSPAGRQRSGWAASQIGVPSYFFLIVCVLSQFATIVISWPTWQVRSSPINLPWIESTPQFSCGILLILSLVLVLISPKRFGMLIHLIVLSIAIGMDQFRCQPQILSITFLMAACIWEPVRRYCLWYLVSMWLWAGIHKFVSPDWFTHVSYHLLSKTSLDANALHYWFALIVALSETTLGVIAWLRPRLAAIGCVGLHLGITIFLIAIGWNFSVLPWNVCTAIVGAWLLWRSSSESPDSHRISDPKVSHVERQKHRLVLPNSILGKTMVVFLLIIPIGMYFGVIRHCFAHALYSGNLPIALVTRHDGIEILEAWQELSFPFPNEQKSYCDYFALTGVAGEKLHIRDPRSKIENRYFWKNADGKLRSLTRKEFFGETAGAVTGVAVDDPRKIYLLEKANATLLKRSKQEMIYAIKFEPTGFDPASLKLLGGLPNLEQIQLADCLLTDDDLNSIKGLPLLWAIGLNHTAITDAGLLQLQDVPNLLVVEHEGTEITAAGLRRIGVPVDPGVD